MEQNLPLFLLASLHLVGILGIGHNIITKFTFFTLLFQGVTHIRETHQPEDSY